ncbi:MAG: polysaccharide biosynthesis C-terminal domain-containing protein, partial [Myxococcota bacterium]
KKVRRPHSFLYIPRSHFADNVGRVTLSEMETDPPTTNTSLSQDATKLAGGSAVVLVGGIGERAVRMGTTWFLSGALGTAHFGLYAFATTVVGIIGAMAPLGMDAGITMYGARYRRSKELNRLKGVLLMCLGSVAITGPLFSVATWLAVRQGWVLSTQPEEAKAITLISAGIALTALLAVVVSVLISRKDMVGQAWSQQIAVPTITLGGAIISIVLGHGIDGVIVSFLVAHAIALLIATKRMWLHDGDLLTDTSIQPAFEWKPLYSYAIPQSFARILYRANLWVDILMLTALASLADVGVYRVSVALAMLGALPVMASTTMFGPVVAELVYIKDQVRLNSLLKIVTRWLLVIAAPLYIGVLLLPDIILGIFDESYLSGERALSILMIGQAVYVACAPTGAILTNAGHSMLNLINGLVAVGLNIALNAWLIPQYGIEGAAIASATALATWSLLRLVQVQVLHQCSPFNLRNISFVIVACGLGLGIQPLLVTQAPLMRLCAVTVSLLLGLAAFWVVGRTEEDAAVLDAVRKRIGR